MHRRPTAAPFAAEALPVLLEHPAIKTELRSVCKLLCTNKQLRDHIHQVLHRQVPACWTTQTAEAFVLWLVRHGSLLSSLEIQIEEKEVVQIHIFSQNVLKKALLQAAAGGLRLRSFTAGVSCSTFLQGLATCSASTLTKIEYRTLPTYSNEATWATEECKTLQLALRQLPSLQSLSLYGPAGRKVLQNDMLPVVSTLQHLTALTLCDLAFEQDLQRYLPTKLVELKMLLQYDWLYPVEQEMEQLTQQELQWTTCRGLREPLHLDNLPQLKSLDLQVLWASGRLPKPMVFSVDQAMPLSITELVITGCTEVEPLLQLRQLAKLRDKTSVLPAAGLKQLRQLPKLQHINLSYRRTDEALLAAPAWNDVQLKGLVLFLWDTQTASRVELLQFVGMVHSLRTLELQFPVYPSGIIGPTTLADVVQHLTALESFILQFYEAADLNTTDVGRRKYLNDHNAAGCALVRVLPRLKHLESLVIDHLPLEQSAVLELGEVSGLTSLELIACDVRSTGAGCLARQLLGLSKLSLEDNSSVQDAAVVAIAGWLTNLTHLNLKASGVTDAGVQQLSRLKQLRVLETGLAGSQGVSCAAKRRAFGWWGD